MPTFSYKARDNTGQAIEGILEAESPTILVEKLTDMGLVVTTVSKASKAQKKKSFSGKKVKRKEMITFTIHLSTVLSAGVPLLTGLNDLVRETEKANFKKVIADVLANVEAGTSLADAMALHPRVFNQLFVSMVRAGEATGRVDEVLDRLIPFLEWQEELASNIRQALAYPSVILLVVTGVVLFLFLFPIPRFAKIFEQQGVDLPIPTRIVVGISEYLLEYGLITLGAIVAVFVILRTLITRTQTGRNLWDRFKLKLPLFGTLFRKVALSRFSHTLGALYRAGVEITESLRIVESVIGNVILARVVRNAHDRIRSGGSMPEALAASGEFPSLVLRMVSIGDETGELDATLEKVSQYYDKEVPYTIRRIFAVVEPLIIVVMGVIVGGVALSIFLPLYSMIQFVTK
ncbi:type II secretion system F family protein [bacterium]|nr:type II secretion system F family protein [bacterium]